MAQGRTSCSGAGGRNLPAAKHSRPGPGKPKSDSNTSGARQKQKPGPSQRPARCSRISEELPPHHRHPEAFGELLGAGGLRLAAPPPPMCAHIPDKPRPGLLPSPGSRAGSAAVANNSSLLSAKDLPLQQLEQELRAVTRAQIPRAWSRNLSEHDSTLVLGTAPARQRAVAGNHCRRKRDADGWAGGTWQKALEIRKTLRLAAVTLSSCDENDSFRIKYLLWSGTGL